MIDIKNISAQVENKIVLEDISMTFELGKNYCILGKNGSGKSSLCNVLMGHPKYKTTKGVINLDGGDMLKMSPNERSIAGLFLSFQTVSEIPGITLQEYLRTIYNIHLKQKSPDTRELSPFVFMRFIKPILEELDISEEFLKRDINVGFSGGEKRKIEILQMKLIGPKYIILDEIDSGLDLDAFRLVANMLKNISTEENSFIIITHYFTILDFIDVDEVYVLENGKIKTHGGAEIIEQIKNTGFNG